MQNNSRFGALTEKAAVDPVVNEDARQLANHMIWKMIVGAGGTGLAAGAGLGLGQLLTEGKPYTPDPSYQSVGIALPKQKDKQIAKLATASLTDALASQTAGHIPSEGLMGGLFGKDTASKWWEIPAVWGLGLPLAGAAGYAGMQAGQGVTNSMRKHTLDKDLENTRNEYARFVEQNLANKHASDADVETALDKLADAIEKRGEGWNSLSDNPIANAAADAPGHAMNMVGSAYLPYAMLSALMSGKLSYDYFKGRSPEKVQEQALRQRALERYGGAKPIHLSPEPGGDPV